MAIMDELEKGRKKDNDRDYTFYMNLYAELKHRREETKKMIKRNIMQMLDEHED